MIQGSPEWFAARLGRVTASRVSAVLSKGRNGGLPATRNAYMDDLIAERLLGCQIGSDFTNDAMQWGTEAESAARTMYSLMMDVDVEQVGFIEHPTIPMAGASLDGLVGGDGFLEIKSPNTITHLETLRRRSVPTKYLHQIHFQAACRPERRWCDWVSYDPRVDEPYQRLFVKRVEIDRSKVAQLEDAVRQFLADMEPVEARVRAFHRRAAA
jgi:YqaJ-like viral recombinase domain